MNSTCRSTQHVRYRQDMFTDLKKKAAPITGTAFFVQSIF
jgi:hypothetical protein